MHQLGRGTPFVHKMTLENCNHSRKEGRDDGKEVLVSASYVPHAPLSFKVVKYKEGRIIYNSIRNDEDNGTNTNTN